VAKEHRTGRPVALRAPGGPICRLHRRANCDPVLFDSGAVAYSSHEEGTRSTWPEHLSNYRACSSDVLTAASFRLPPFGRHLIASPFAGTTRTRPVDYCVFDISLWNAKTLGTLRRRIHLGIDYGTSGSKIVLRDYGAPGGERATVLVYAGSYRFSSSVLVVDNNLRFGLEPDSQVGGEARTWYESIKMRVAAEVTGDYEKFCYGPLPKFPDGFSARSFAALTIWWLLSQGRAAARKHLPDQELAVGMTIGIPMSFYADSGLRATFLDIARAAWYLSRLNGDLEAPSIALDRARSVVDQAFDEVRRRDVSPNSIRDWIRSEAEAAMYSAFRSPSVAAGTYAKVDVGAGTTNASVFRITDTFEGGRWLKSGMAFYGADAGSTGMDAIDRALFEFDPTDKTDCLGLRGLEAKILANGRAVSAV
jgi:hypothetical protein